MKRYVLFAWVTHCELGGLNDMKESFETQKEAEDHFRKGFLKNEWEEGHIVDWDNYKIVQKLDNSF